MRRPRRRSMVAALAVAALALTGCAESPTSAATVDGTVITRTELEQAVTGANQVLAGSGNQLSRDQVLSVMIQGTVAEQLAEQRGTPITDGQRQSKLSPAALAVPAARPFVDDVANTSIVSAAIGQQALAKQIAAAKIAVNPRFGVWQPTRSVSVIADNGSLSQVLQPSTP